MMLRARCHEPRTGVKQSCNAARSRTGGRKTAAAKKETTAKSPRIALHVRVTPSRGNRSECHADVTPGRVQSRLRVVEEAHAFALESPEPELHYYTIHGYRRAFVVGGRGPAVLLIHG